MSSQIKFDNPDACISCNICHTACPVAKASRLYRGPKLNGPALTRLRHLVKDEDPMVHYCSNCKNCDRACPSGTPIAALNMKARAEYYKNHEHDKADLLLSHNEQMGKLMTSIPFISGPIANIGMKVARATNMISTMGVSNLAPLPSYAAVSFYQRFDFIKQPSARTKVLFFPGCYVNYNDPQVGIDLIEVLNRNNIEVVIDKRLVCCGSPILSTGYLDQVEENAVKNSALLRAYVEAGFDILTTCTTCSLFLKQEYEELFNIKDTKVFTPHVYDAMEYLQMRKSQGLMSKNLGKLHLKLAYHTPCHLRVQGMGRPGLGLMHDIPGVEIDDVQKGCCGLSGVYGYKKMTAEIGHKIGEPLREHIKASDADMGLCECNICRLQMQNGTGKKAIHPISVLARAYREQANQ